MDRIAFVTTCKNRLHHLQQTLPRWVAEGPDEIVVVDYGCPQGTGDWVRDNWPQVTVVRVDDDPGFSIARARNLGAAAATAEWVCFIDADILVAGGWVAWMREHLVTDCFYRAGMVESKRLPETWGTVIVESKVCRAVGGYDELFSGWGGEDADLYDRLHLAGARGCAYPASFVEAISHTDEERFAYSERKTKSDNRRWHNFYRYAKYVWMTVGGVAGDLSPEHKAYLRGLVDAAFDAPNGTSGSVIPTISFDVNELGAWLPEERRTGARCRCALWLEPPGLLHRTRRRLRRVWDVLRSLGKETRDDGQMSESADLRDALVRPLLVACGRASVADSIRSQCSTFMYGMPSRHRVRVVCSYDLPALTGARTP